MRINLARSSCWHLIVYIISGVALLVALVELVVLGDLDIVPVMVDFGAGAVATVDLVLHGDFQYNSDAEIMENLDWNAALLKLHYPGMS